MGTKKEIKKICMNCKLFDAEKSTCAVVVLHEGQRLRLPVSADDACFFEGQYFDPTIQAKQSFTDEIKQVRFWVETKDGKKTDGDGIVKIEYPLGFFGVDQKDK